MFIFEFFFFNQWANTSKVKQCDRKGTRTGGKYTIGVKLRENLLADFVQGINLAHFGDFPSLI